MFSAIVRVQRWWGQAPRPSAGEGMPFEIVCVCGQRHQGWRQATHQIVTCTGCGRRRFVLPISPLPRVSAPDPTPPSIGVPPVSRRRSPWFGPLVGAGVTLLCVIGIFAVILVFVLPPRSGKVAASIAPEQLEAQIAEGQKAIGDGDFARAVQSFDAAREMVKRNPAPAGRLRELNQLRRQAALMADWPGEPLELVLARASQLNDDDWQTLANLRRGRSLVFDGTLRRDATGQLHATRPPPVEGQTFQVKLQSVKLLKHLPLNDPTRVIFLARLANARREAPGVCAIELDADSGVLITDKGVAKRCGYAIGDAEVGRVLKRQTRWVAELPTAP